MRALVRSLFASIFISVGAMAQGPYAPAASQSGSSAIHRDSSIIQAWASECSVERGLMDIADPSQGFASLGTDSDGIGYADGAVVSLGDSGIAILQFNSPIYDGPGDDFAIFENSFSDTFLELAKVFVSSDGINYVEFPSHSLTPDSAEIGGFGSTDPTNLNNLAGKYRAQYGTPFDLNELADSLAVSINSITHVMLVDAVGTTDSSYCTLDTALNKIVDPYPTAFTSGGFDLDGIAFLHNPIASVSEKLKDQFVIYPNPALNRINIKSENVKIEELSIYSSNGQLLGTYSTNQLKTSVDVSQFKPGIYLMRISTLNGIVVKSFVKK